MTCGIHELSNPTTRRRRGGNGGDVLEKEEGEGGMGEG